MTDLSILLKIHIVSALAALILGAIVFALPKGGLAHRRWAKLYVLSMLVTSGVVIFVPASILEFGDSGVGFFHLFILVGGVSSLVGAFALWRWRVTRDPEWLRNHQMRFTFSYAGLWMAGISQVATNPRFGVVEALTAGQFWFLFAATNLAIFGIALVFANRYIMRGDPRRRYALKP